MAGSLIISVGDTRLPFAVVCMRNGKPENISSYTAKFLMKKIDGTVVVDETSSNVTKQPTFDVTASASTNRLLIAEHRVENGDRIVLSNSGGALPAGLTAGTKYYARDCDDDTFRVSLTPDGQPVDIIDAGAGTHSAYIVGEVQYAPQSVDVATAGEYRCWFRLYSGSNPSTVPLGNGIPLFIVDRTI